MTFLEKAKHRCLQYMTAQLCRGALNLLELKRTMLWWDLSSQTSMIQSMIQSSGCLGSWDTNTYLCVCTHTTSVASLSIPKPSFSCSSLHDYYATHI